MPTPQIAVALHIFNLGLVNEFEEYLLNISKAGFEYDLYIAVQKGTDYTSLREVWPDAMYIERENRGFDIGSFLVSLTPILEKPYEYILKLHTKQHPQWRKALIEPLLSTPERVRYSLSIMADPAVGMVGAKDWMISIGNNLGHNKIHLNAISQQWKVPVQPFRFIGGTIFWIRASILRDAVREVPDVDLNTIAQSLNTIESLDWSWYLMTYPELRIEGINTQEAAETHWIQFGQGQGRACNCLYARINQIGRPNCDGMLEHAYERFFGMLVTHARQRVVGIGKASLLDQQEIHPLVLYHPQFDWSNQSAGHQPHPDLGQYNSSDHRVMSKQVELMRKYGIGGICYRITPETASLVHRLNTGLPFCLSWVPAEAFTPVTFNHLYSYPQYIRVQGKPLLFLPGNTSPVPGFEILTEAVELPRIETQVPDTRSFTQELHELFTQYLQQADKVTLIPQYLVLQSWNDWRQQVALEPSAALGYKYLQEYRNTLRYFS